MVYFILVNGGVIQPLNHINLMRVGVNQFAFSIKFLAEKQFAIVLGIKFAANLSFTTVLCIKLIFESLTALYLTILF